jgi:glycosyltransferase involved in cell wall biosynthesis
MASFEMIKASVVVCSHNPRAQYLRRVLDSLRSQTLPIEQWELIFVDNASKESLAAAWDLSWHPSARHIQETELGIAIARQRGIRESTADLIVFVDDDNVLAPDYLSEAVKISQQWPQLGVWGGSIAAEFEAQPSPDARDFFAVLAIREVRSATWTNDPTHFEVEPWGAGLCIRSSVASAYCEQYEKFDIRLGRQTGISSVPGEDTEMCFAACKIGLGMGLFPELKLTHLISKNRVEKKSLLSAAEGIQIARHLIDFKWRGITPRSPFSVREMVTLVGHLVLNSGLARQMYLAHARAKVKARRIIALDRARGSRPSEMEEAVSKRA